RTGWLFTRSGRVLIKQARYARDEQPIDSTCGCPVCLRYSRAYLHHLYRVKEMLAARLNTIHNLWYFAEFLRRMRSAILDGSFAAFRETFYRDRGLGLDAVECLAAAESGEARRAIENQEEKGRTLC
ncbi:MAG TPA: tRNA-guanine transglycosylase, partial [Nitrospira sp.]|nr:tRNA-guanine transglycosylase [Nitrospira sp.]